MSPTSLDEFATTGVGLEFTAAYQALRRRWPDDAESVDVPGRFGSTRVTMCGRGTPTVLLHGGGATSMAWTAVAGPLASGRRVIAPDLIGEPGLSRNDGDRLRIADDLVDWLDHTVTEVAGTEPIDLVGHSYGAMVALAYAIAKPERVAHLVLLDPTSCFAGMSARYLWRALPLLLRPSPARQRRLLTWETCDAPLDADWLRLACTGAAFPASKTVVPKRPADNAFRTLAGVRVTVALAPGSRVHDVGAVARKVGEVLPAARVVELSEGTHHTLPLWPVDEVVDAITSA